MGCGCSSLPNEETHGPKVLRVDIHMTYDEDDSDNETPTPVIKKKRTTTTTNKPGFMISGGLDGIEEVRSRGTSLSSQGDLRDSTEEEKGDLVSRLSEDHGDSGASKEVVSLHDISVMDASSATKKRPSHIKVVETEPDSDDDSDYYATDEDEDSDGDLLEMSSEEVVNQSLRHFFRPGSKSRSSDSSNDNSNEDTTDLAAVKDNLTSLLSFRSFSADDNENEKVIKQSVKHIMSFRSRSTDDNEEGSTEEAKNFSLKSMWLSFKASSEDDVGDDNMDDATTAEVLEVSLRSMLSFRATA
jgi:hypothetical protein